MDSSQENRDISFKKYNRVKWTLKEKVFRKRQEEQDTYTRSNITFTFAFLSRLRRSVFGAFLKTFNKQQTQSDVLNKNKLDIAYWNVKKLKGKQLEFFEEDNAIVYDYNNILKEGVAYCNNSEFDVDFLHKNLEILKINNSYIKTIDSGLRNFQNLRVLQLVGNFISDIPGFLLPRKLLFLELFNNGIQSLENLVKNPPKKLIYLGLGRNKLTHKSHLHLLAESGSFTWLRQLDLSDNDIYKTQRLLKSLQVLPALASLSLEGNPCSMIPIYKEVVLRSLPELNYLDSTEINKNDRRHLIEDLNLEPAQLVLQCYRIVGLAPPPKDKKVTQTIHMEFYLPLFEDVHEAEIPDDNISDDILQEIKKEPEKEEPMKNDKKNKKGKKGAEKKVKVSLYNKPNEYEEDTEKYNFSFKTDRVPWSKIIEFPPVILEPPDQNLKLLRDVFRTSVKVKIIYLKTKIMEKKKKKSKKEPKPKGKNKKIDNNSIHNSMVSEQSESATEMVLKRVTLCEFWCDLETLNWSDESLDFYWADHPDFNKKKAMLVEGCLKDLIYDEGKSVSDNNNKKKKDKESETTKNSTVKQPLPKLFTCQLGFGVKRRKYVQSDIYQEVTDLAM